MADLDRDKIWRDFHQMVNMAPTEIADWLDSDESNRVGWKGPDGKGDGESVGHASGRRIVEILKMEKAELGTEDWRHMRKVVGFVRRHLGQRPENQVTSRWRYSLMNWGHDPTRD